MDRAVTSYTETLGLRLLLRAGDHWASIDAGEGLQLGLHPAGPHGPTPGTVGAATVGFTVDEPIERVIATLEERGAAVQGPVIDDSARLKPAFFADPDGSQLYVTELARD